MEPENKPKPEKISRSLPDIVDMIVNHAYKILEWKLIAAMDQKIGMEEEAKGLPEGYFNFDHKKLDEVLNIVKPMLKESQQAKKFEAKSSSDIITMLGNGRISIDEAAKLLALVSKKTEVEIQEKKAKIKNKMLETFDDK